jgi:hypothetical protein
VRIELEYAPRCAWHMDCPTMSCAPMKWLTGSLTIEDGSVLGEFECTACGQRGFAGTDKQRRRISRPATPTERADPKGDSDE